MQYQCLSSKKYCKRRYTLTNIRKHDLNLIKKWRNEQIEVLRQKKTLTNKDQEVYYQKIIRKMYQKPYPDSILFRVLYEDDFIGYGGLVHIDWKAKKGEVSFLNETSRSKNEGTYKKDFFGFYNILLRIMFRELGFKKLTTETYEFRTSTIKWLENIGFKMEGRFRKRIYKNGLYFDSFIHGLRKTTYLKNEFN